MRILLLHPNFPAQFRHLAPALAADGRHDVVFVTARRQGQLPGVRKLLYTPPTASQYGAAYSGLRGLTRAVMTGEAVYRLAQMLRDQGFVPDVMLGHSGWGPTLFLKDVFPSAELMCYMEWFYHAHHSDLDFDPAHPPSDAERVQTRLKNTPFLLDLQCCDRALTPTQWQYQQFPAEYQSKITVCHDGIDTRFFRPGPVSQLALADGPLDLNDELEVVTYVARGMEPYRGFPQVMEAAALLLRDRPHCHMVIVGEDRVAYGRPRSDGKTYRQVVLDQWDGDRTRLHFTGYLPYETYRTLLQASSVHVYLTYPFVLSWSVLEAMATGCAVVGSRTAPVMEVLQDGVNGRLVEFFAPAELASCVAELLDDPAQCRRLGAAARQSVMERYSLDRCLPRLMQCLGVESETRASPPPSPLPDPWELF